MDQLLLTFGDIPHHGPVLLAWVLLRHTLRPDESSPVIRRIGNTALQLGVFKYISTMLKGLGVSGNNVREQRCTLGSGQILKKVENYNFKLKENSLSLMVTAWSQLLKSFHSFGQLCVCADAIIGSPLKRS